MVGRTILIVLILIAKGAFWLIEQPVSSIMHEHPMFQWLFRHFRIYRVHTYTGAFGAKSLKPTVLYSAHECIGDLKRYKPTRKLNVLAAKYKDSNGVTRVKGKRSALRSSQAYTKKFARAFLTVYEKHKQKIKADAIEMQKRFDNMKDPAMNLLTESRVCGTANLKPVLHTLHCG